MKQLNIIKYMSYEKTQNDRFSGSFGKLFEHILFVLQGLKHSFLLSIRVVLLFVLQNLKKITYTSGCWCQFT